MSAAGTRPSAPAIGGIADATGSDALLSLIVTSLDQDSAEEIVTIDLSGKSSIADHMVVCSGRSSRHVAALAEKLIERLKAEAGIVARVEGKEAADWVLIDAGDVIVHVFRPEVRSFYQLEKMWQTEPDRTARRI
ncbi:ribosome silencing factor [Limibaculum sp. FT325]|uniref:ribosome silencing factor n=1 Tax=Thermohalobaculum sediminis TaxID=2939436 RepID=UPI0020BE3E9C|nr:ribosome silencing factor [Limibaculum sediminis]MCL5776999.1 ribosome silencing factor [Limibaculum sediminis]